MRPVLPLCLLLTLLGCSGGGDSAPIATVTPARPTAGFQTSPAAPQVGQPVSFTDTSTGSPTSWAWAFGDGTTATAQHPTHTYASAGPFTVTLTATNAGGSGVASQTLTVSAATQPPTAAFTSSPASPVAGQPVAFTDTSTGSPTSWAWTFGDGSTSTAQHPTHTYAGAGAFPVTLTVANTAGNRQTTQTLQVTSAPQTATFGGTLVLGAPTATAIRGKVFSADQSGSVVLRYGVGALTQTSAPVALVAGTPAEVTLTGLAADTAYVCQLAFTPASGTLALGPMGRFHTARPAGSTFTFTIQADSHMDENSDQPTYLRALGNVLADGPDFHVDLGDTFMCEKHDIPFSATDPPAANAAEVETRYRFERANFGTMSYAVPLFLVNGNHEGEAGWAANGTADSLAVWTTLARKRHFVNPIPDGFYTGDGVSEPFVGQRGAYYAWTWGDALFIVLDPFWQSMTQPNKDPWALTLGDRQYQWLQQTLSTSAATWKFVFIHNLVGGLDGQMRGGVEAAPFFEWGGKNLDGTSGFATKRPGWAMPLHDLFKAHKVTAVFHGHDHLYCRQELDGIVYQEVPQPSAKNYQSGPGLATEYHYTSGTVLSSSGHMRVTVAPGQVSAAYVRTWLPSQETPTRKNGTVEDTWTVKGNGPSAPTAAFGFSPTSPVAGQPVAFTDASTGGATSWAWDFGDGSVSSLQNPSHTFTANGTYTVALQASNAGGSGRTTRAVTVAPGSSGAAFAGNAVLGNPTSTGVQLNLYSVSQSGTVTVAYGVGTALDRQTSPAALAADTPLELSLTGLPADSACSYRVGFQGAGATSPTWGEVCTFHTARAPGSTFTFALQGDSHPERASQFDGTLYTRTLQTAASDKPDFYVCMGDDFSVDTLDPATVTQAQVRERYTIQRPYLGLIGKNAPVFLVNGNHEQAARYLLDGTANNVAVWAQNARNTLYSQPAPDAFYSGNAEVVPFIGLLRNHYAWTWGDALFVVIDPYWSSPVCVDNPFDGSTKRSNLWDVTHGDAQFQWLKGVLEASKAKWKFVFAHHVMGTGRGGVELASLYEWGGYDGKGTWLFPQKRPTWSHPIHQLLVANKVTVFFQGHDHIWVHQTLDGVTYQTLPEPADPTYTLWNADAFLSGDKVANTGYGRVTVSPTEVKVEYIRTWLPKDEGAGKVNGSVASSYVLR